MKQDTVLIFLDILAFMVKSTCYDVIMIFFVLTFSYTIRLLHHGIRHILYTFVGKNFYNRIDILKYISLILKW